MNEYNCQICSKTFAQKVHLEGHMENIHFPIKKDCPVCGKTFPERYLISHIAKIHLDPEEKVCSICDFETNNHNSLKLHMIRVHNIQMTIRNKTKNPLHNCMNCNFTTSKIEVFQLHQSRDHKVNSKCEFCSFETSTSLLLREHKIAEHLNNRYKCNMCDHQAKTKGRLTNHFNSKHRSLFDNNKKQKDFKCTECNYVSNNKSHLKLHEDSIHKKM